MSEATAPIDAGQESSPADNGQAEQLWFDSAPDEVKGYIQNKGWDDPIKAVTSYQELEKFRGASEDQLLKLPKDMDAEGAMDEIYNRLGRPESVEGYNITLPEDVSIDTKRLDSFKEVAYQIGLNDKQVEALIKADVDYNSQFLNGYQEDLAQKQEIEMNGLKKEWGAAFEERSELARRFIASNLPEGVDKVAMLNAIEESVGSAVMLKMFANAGDKFREDKVPDGSGDRPFGYSAEQAKADKVSLMAELQADKARLDNYNKGIGADVLKMQKLNQIIAG